MPVHRENHRYSFLLHKFATFCDRRRLSDGRFISPPIYFCSYCKTAIPKTVQNNQPKHTHVGIYYPVYDISSSV